MSTLTMEAPTKSPEAWRSEIAALHAANNERMGILESKRQRKQEIALAATNGDKDAIAEARTLTTEIAELLWLVDIGDDALIVAQRHLQAAEKSLQDAKIAAILAERDRIQSEVDAMRPRFAEVVGELVTMLKEADLNGKRMYQLADEAGQGESAYTRLRRTRRVFAGYLSTELRETYLYREWNGMEWPHPATRKEARELFGVAPTVADVPVVNEVGEVSEGEE